MNRFVAVGLSLLCLSAVARGQDDTDFELHIRPVLAGTCFRCHGGDKISGGLRVDTQAALLKGGEHGPAVVPGDPERSLIVRALRHTQELKMPPTRKLPDEVIGHFARWVKDGARWPARPVAMKSGRHWAFEPVRPIEPPTDPTGWAETPVDRFIAARQRELGVRPVAPADKRTLLRRITFDLTGLPPTPEEMAAFLADTSPEAYRKVVERLLASPHYGERWGRHWMDVVRYADTAGDNADYPVPEARLYRDYIIDAFNADKPYDQFVCEQLAGDVLASHGPRERYAEQVVATTFLGLSRRYLTAPYEQWHLTLEDTIETTGRAFLGLTLRCARCHDHKFDPVTQQDYYALYGIFASTVFPYAGSEELASMKRPREHFAALVPPGETANGMARREHRLKELSGLIAGAEKAGPPMKAELEALKREQIALQRSNLPLDVPGAYSVHEGKPADVPLQRAGDPDKPGPVVQRGAPKFLGRPLAIAPGSSGRVELAQWIASKNNPLTARVMVNRLWQHHFGKGLVATASNFGLRGEPPSHPELLDYLAHRFVASGWSVKAMHRLIVLSRTYQLAAADDADNAARDPGNRGYWRYDRRRLDAEAIRDALLMVGGNLDRSRPGPHPFPPLATWGWTQHNPFKDVYPSRHRSVYLMTQRLQRHPFLGLFDGPDTNTTTEARPSSTVPLQALYWMNNPFVWGQAEGLARRCVGGDDKQRIRRAYELAFARPATEEEVHAAGSYLRQCRQALARSDDTEAWTSLAHVLLCANEFVYVE